MDVVRDEFNGTESGGIWIEPLVKLLLLVQIPA